MKKVLNGKKNKRKKGQLKSEEAKRVESYKRTYYENPWARIAKGVLSLGITELFRWLRR